VRKGFFLYICINVLLDGRAGQVRLSEKGIFFFLYMYY
jgi:hypothetical protein